MITATAFNKPAFEYIPKKCNTNHSHYGIMDVQLCQQDLLHQAKINFPGIKKMINFSDYIVDALLEIQAREGFTVTEMAKRVGISKQYMSNVLNRKKRVGRKTALRISSAFDIDIASRPDDYPPQTKKDAELIETLKELVKMQKMEIERLHAEIEALQQNPMPGDRVSHR